MVPGTWFIEHMKKSRWKHQPYNLPSVLPQHCTCSPGSTDKRTLAEKLPASFKTILKPLVTWRTVLLQATTDCSSKLHSINPTPTTSTVLFTTKSTSLLTDSSHSHGLNLLWTHTRERPKIRALDYGYFKAYTFHSYLLQLSF